ncbi:MAG TPA: CsgG/HfaB family protein [Anaeromyxobacter sp.]|nr:CsgG/HfaB family protein [Anaeromyxobacter sp.]
MTRSPLPLLAAAALAGCATVSPPAERAESPAPAAQQQAAQQQAQQPIARRFKLKIAVGRFTNETNYGRSLLTDAELDRIGKQAADMLTSRLVQSGQFLVLERPDVAKIEREQAASGLAGLVGADTLVIGSVTEFGRSVGGKTGFLSSTKVQTARAKVDVRLVDVRTGHAYFSAIGAGEASTESGEIAGFGSQADYDATLNDRAIAAAISNMVGVLVGQLGERRWRTDILEVKGGQIFISGGKSQGLKPGDVLAVMQAGDVVKSKQSGFDVTLPPRQVAQIRVVALFGDTETGEGSVCELISGALPAPLPPNLFVSDAS